MPSKVGAPRGGRVHFITFTERKWMREGYERLWKYSTTEREPRHWYRYTRNDSADRIDEYTVIHRNSKSWLLIYIDHAKPPKYAHLDRQPTETPLCLIEYFKKLGDLMCRIDELHEEKEAREAAYKQSKQYKRKVQKLEYGKNYYRKPRELSQAEKVKIYLEMLGLADIDKNE